MKTTPNFGLPYPENTDNSTTWEYWQQLATALDTLLATYMGPRIQFDDTASVATTSGTVKILPFANTEFEVPASGWRVATEGGGTTVLVPADGLYMVWASATWQTVTSPKGLRTIEPQVWNGSAWASLGVVDGGPPVLTSSSTYKNACGLMALKKDQKLMCMGYQTQGADVNVTARRWGLALMAPYVPAQALFASPFPELGDGPRNW